MLHRCTLAVSIIAVSFTFQLCGCESTRHAAQRPSAHVQFYEGFGNYSREISTKSPLAQRWFDQGLQLLYGFNHDEAIRSFSMAAQADPDCAMAWWGVAYAYGLHINNPEMGEEESRQAWLAAQRAKARLRHASPIEQTLILAIQERYAWPVPEDRRPLDEAYAEAMRKAWLAHPDDADIGALYAESLMNLQPWDLWTHDGEPKGRTLEIVQVLEDVMRLNQNHPGANHFYIHAVEASLTPERALPAADRLAHLVPGSGHLVHMPSHIYIRTGRYAQAAESNERAIAVDEAYFSVAPPPRFYSLYFLHNIHFLAYASMMEGRYEAAIGAARKIEDRVPESFLREYVTIADGLMPAALHVMIRFGKWLDILDEPEPESYRLMSRVQRHYARAVAFAALGRTEQAANEIAAFDALAMQVDDSWFVGNNPASSVLAISRRVAAAELLYREMRFDEAFALLREAVVLEEKLAYDEPPGWMQPVRHALGALLLAEGHADEAEQVYRDDLARHPNNCWALLGLSQSLMAQARNDEVVRLEPEVRRAWARADVVPKASCYCHPAAR
ncbi:MAG TPA: hypothetical protein PK400_00655 [Phycisphaerales bacterium]|nr:hypothetical protein [Phycisphaerales bacterium]HRQ74527.1 hypothetical protein [Phycisphaerales bacterium]